MKKDHVVLIELPDRVVRSPPNLEAEHEVLLHVSVVVPELPEGGRHLRHDLAQVIQAGIGNDADLMEYKDAGVLFTKPLYD